MGDLKVGDIFRYRMENMWCRHGVAVVLPSGELKDTYWRGLKGVDNSEYGQVKESFATPESRIGNVDDFVATNQRDINLFADEDTLWIPTGGGSREFWVRKDAKPNAETAADFLRSQIEQQRSAIHSAEWRIEQLQKELGQYEPPPPATGTLEEANAIDGARKE